MTVSPPVAKLASSTPIHVAFAALAMGSWAAFANQGHGGVRMILAAAIQGLLSGSITFFLKRALEAMAARLPLAVAGVVPPLVTCAVVLAVLVAAHTVAGTPEIARTIALPYAVSSAYAWIYNFGLFTSRRRATS